MEIPERPPVWRNQPDRPGACFDFPRRSNSARRQPHTSLVLLPGSDEAGAERIVRSGARTANAMDPITKAWLHGLVPAPLRTDVAPVDPACSHRVGSGGTPPTPSDPRRDSTVSTKRYSHMQVSLGKPDGSHGSCFFFFFFFLFGTLCLDGSWLTSRYTPFFVVFLFCLCCCL